MAIRQSRVLNVKKQSDKNNTIILHIFWCSVSHLDEFQVNLDQAKLAPFANTVAVLERCMAILPKIGAVKFNLWLIKDPRLDVSV